MPVHAIKSLEEFYQTINSGDTVVVVDFWATWSAPCRDTSAFLQKLADEPSLKAIEFCNVDIDVQRSIAREVGVSVIPTYIAYKEGKKLNEYVGTNLPDLEKFIHGLVA